MAKQTFTTGQVLTAAQMTSLQQTAMLGGAASAKTASYTLVAADAGTAISMSNASATTITVNTALFAAGDTVQITNLGAGVCTITAGTATVNTSASLALAQYESGTLVFTSTSAAIFIKGAGAAPASGGMTLISSTALSGASVTFSSIPATYKDLRLIFRNPLVATGSASIVMRVNGDSGSNRYRSTGGSVQPGLTFNATYWEIFYENSSSVGNGLGEVIIPDYANATSWKIMRSIAANVDPSNSSNTGMSAYFNIYNQTAAISSLVVLPNTGNWTSGTVELYGVN
jgi:hypothetical protein